MPGIRIIYNTYFIRKTFGNIGAHAILLIPDLGVSYEIFRPLIGKLEDRFYVIAVQVDVTDNKLKNWQEF